MKNIILHHYADSPFSEKIRLLLGYKQQNYAVVSIPVIMPKPDLIPLTGGYRRTPVLQIGADIYCDSALIAKVIDRLVPENSIYPIESIATAAATAQWTDTIFFWVCVSMAFQPKAMASNPLMQDAEASAAFMADRAQFMASSGSLVMDPASAHPYFLSHLKHLDHQLQSSPFLFGDAPTIADFSTYHCCWFVHRIESLTIEFEPFKHVLNWFERMNGFGHGELIEMEGSEALTIARHATPSTFSKTTLTEIDHLAIGDDVVVNAIDYGCDPIYGKLQVSSIEELVVSLDDPQIGTLAVHFPRIGFQVRKQT
ncbi:MAG: glutathione S-transferase family protein [Pseudomonadales bacterium]|jgi:glutathione S-transferase